MNKFACITLALVALLALLSLQDVDAFAVEQQGDGMANFAEEVKAPVRGLKELFSYRQKRATCPTDITGQAVSEFQLYTKQLWVTLVSL